MFLLASRIDPSRITSGIKFLKFEFELMTICSIDFVLFFLELID